MTSKPWRPLALGLAALLLPLGIVQSQAASCAAHVTPTSTALDSAIVAAMREYLVPGAAISVVRDGRVEYLAGFGCANEARGIAVDPRQTVFHVASVSKPFVALAAVQLATRGVVDLHTDVNRYLRGMQVPPGWGRPITLHDLLTHTAGLEESIVGYSARTPADIRPLGEFLAEKLPRRGWAPGDVTGYSNYGYALAGYVVESATRIPFAEYERTEVFAPLGMTRSSFSQPPPADLARDAALAYRCSKTGCEAIVPDFRSAYPPGGLVTTASDMTRFMLAELGAPVDGKQVLSDSVLTLMHTRQFTHDPALPGLTYGFAEDEVAGQPALSHAGSAGGFLSLVMLVPRRQLGVFVVTNGGTSRFGAVALAAIDSLMDPTRPAPPASERLTPRAIAIDPTGAYRLTRYAHKGAENLPALFNGQLHIRRDAGDTISVFGLGDANGRYVPVAANRWRRVNGSDLIAVRVKDGKVTHVFGPQSFFGTQMPAAFERLAWFDEPHFLNEALSYVVALPMLAILIWPIMAGIVWLVRRRSRLVAHVRPPTGRTKRGYAVAAAVAFSALAAWFGFGFIAMTNRAAERGSGEIFYGLTPLMRVLAWAPVTLGLLAVIIVAATLVGWRRRWWSIPSLLLYTTIAINAVLFVALLVRWGYFPVATG
jgi:CubicO group peptidase (beta-lactamase class C family)